MLFLRCFNSMQVVQVPSVKYPARNKTITLEELHYYEVNCGRDTLTNTAKVIFPKNLIAQDLEGNDIPLLGTNKNIGTGDSPLFMRGDKISIQAGYWYEDSLGKEQQYVKLLFDGFITRVYSQMDITLECEDYMYLLKQIPAPNKIWGKGLSFQQVLQECIKGTAAETAGIKVNTQSKSTIEYENGVFLTKNQTIAQVLEGLRKDLNMPCWLKDKELRIWYPIYYPQDVQTPRDTNQKHYVFDKNVNIISDSLSYQLKEDVVVSAVATSSYSQKVTVQTKDGEDSTATRNLKVFVYSDRKTQSIKSMVITDDSQIPENTEGQRFDFKFYDAKTTDELIKRATEMLEKSYYTGFRGNFTTFLMPYIPVGDNIILRDALLPDKDGVYKVRGVKYSGGHGLGGRQDISLHYRIFE